MAVETLRLILLGVAILGLICLVVSVASAGRASSFGRRAPTKDMRNGKDNASEAEGLLSSEGFIAELPGVYTRRLRACGITIHPSIFALALVLLAAFAGLQVFRWYPHTIYPGLLGACLVVYMVISLILYVGYRRSSRFENKLAEAIDFLVAALRGGENPRQALTSAAEVAAPRVRMEFEELGRRVHTGMPVHRALLRMIERYDSEGVRVFASALAAKWTAGGDLAPTLEFVNRIIRDRLRNRTRLRSQLAGARASALFVAAMPYVAMMGFILFHPVWIRRLFGHPLGPPLLIMAVFLQITGFLWLQYLARDEV